MEILVEEIAEVVQLKSKIARFGLNNKFKGISSAKKLKRELADMMLLWRQ